MVGKTHAQTEFPWARLTAMYEIMFGCRLHLARLRSAQFAASLRALFAAAENDPECLVASSASATFSLSETNSDISLDNSSPPGCPFCESTVGALGFLLR